MAKTKAQIIAEAQVVKNATEVGENTATRVGGVLEDLAEADGIVIIPATGTQSGGNITLSSNPFTQVQTAINAGQHVVVRVTMGDDIVDFSMNTYSASVATYIGTANFLQLELQLNCTANSAVITNRDTSDTFSTGESVPDVGIDATPTQGSNNLVKSGGVAEVVEPLKQAADYIITTEEVDASSDLTITGYYQANNGAKLQDSNWVCSGKIPVGVGSKIQYSFIGHTAIASIAAYDATQSYVQAKSIIAPTNEVRISGEYIVEEGVAFVAFSDRANASSQRVALINKLMDGVVLQQSKIVENIGYYEQADGRELLNLTGYYTKQGTIKADSTWVHSEKIKVYLNDAFEYNLYGHTAVPSVAAFDANGNILLDKSIVATSNAARLIGTYIVDEDVFYVAFTDYVSQASQRVLNMQTMQNGRILDDIYNIIGTGDASLLPIKNDTGVKIAIDANTKIILYGDSISSTDYPWYKNWMELLTGASVYNGGFSGYTTAQLASATCLQRIFDYAPNAIVILVGGNDSGNVVGTFGAILDEPHVQETDISVAYNGTYFIQAVSYIIRKVKDYYYNIITRAGLTLPVSMNDTSSVSAVDVLVKPHIVVCTTLPQKRTTGSYSDPANWLRKRNAVVECCNKYNVHCVDLYSLFNIDWSLEPSWQGPTDKVNCNGIYTMDGLHPNKWGYELISRIVAKALV